MWFSYPKDDNWVPVEIDRVKEIQKQNRDGVIPPDLGEMAELETKLSAKVLDYENVVGQDSLTRLDDRNKNRNNNNNKNRNNNNNNNNRPRNPNQQEQRGPRPQPAEGQTPGKPLLTRPADGTKPAEGQRNNNPNRRNNRHRNRPNRGGGAGGNNEQGNRNPPTTPPTA